MNIISYENNEAVKYNTAVALGNFDGLHIGHQILINTMTKSARERNLKSAVLLFKNHTRTVTKDLKSGILTNYKQKIDILDDLGVDIVYTMDFNRDIMKLSCESFVENILVKKLRAKLVVIGFNYKFGYKASGDSIYLAKLGEKYGFEVIVLGPVYENGIIVSSTIIRKLIKNAKIKEATNLLGKPYTINGIVVDGKKRGTTMGFPTANLKLDSNYLIPKFGVYKTNTIFEGNKYLSITNVGKNPTFEGENISIETHILNFNENIYGKKISVEFIDFIRDEKRFTNKDALKDQVMKDIEAVKLN